MNEVEWLTGVYYSDDYWCKDKIPNAKLYYAIMLAKGNIYITYRNEKPVGFVEVWGLTFEQLGRVACRVFNPTMEDTTHGPVGYVKDVYVNTKDVLRKVINKGYEANPGFYFIVWRRKGKDFVVYRSRKNG